MDIKTYVKYAGNTCANFDDNTMDNHHMILGMLTETGELADIFKKSLAYNKEIDWVNAGEEIGDIMWYIANFCRINNLDLNKILETNIAKLQARYPDSFTEESALNRDLEREREVLEDDNPFIG